MVVFDEVSTIAFEDADERIDPVLYPNLAALAKDATWFRYATAPTDMTGTATPTILTGSVAERYHPPILSSYPRNLFTLLGGQYRMKVSQEATDLCPRDLCEDASGESAAARDRALASDLGLVYLHVIAPDGIERDLPSVSDTVGNFGSDTGTTKTEGSPGHTGHVEVLHELGGGRPARFENFVRSIDRTARPTLYYKHSLLPHVPFQYFPDGHRYRTQPHDVIPGLIDEPSWDNEYLLQQAYQRHLLPGRLCRPPARHAAPPPAREGPLRQGADRGHGGQRRELPAPRRQSAPRHPGTVEDIADTPLFIKRPFEHCRPHLEPPRADRGHPPLDRRRARHRHALARRWLVGLRQLRPHPIGRRRVHALGPQAQALPAGVQAPHPRLARAQDPPLRRARPATRPVRDRPPPRADRTAGHAPSRARRRAPRSTTRPRTPPCTCAPTSSPLSSAARSTTPAGHLRETWRSR